MQAETSGHILTRELKEQGTVQVNYLKTGTEQVWDVVNLTWSGFQSEGAVSICLPVPWSLWPVAGVREMLGETEGGRCKRLFISTGDGQAVIENQSSFFVGKDARLLFAADFFGAVALSGETLKADSNGLPHEFDYNALSMQGSLYGGGGDTPFDVRKGFFYQGGVGSEYLVTLLPFGSGLFSGAANMITLRLISPEGEVSEYSLSRSEIEALKASGRLVNVHGLIHYLRQRHHLIIRWHGILAEIQRLLGLTSDQVDENTARDYLLNLITEAGSLTIETGPDGQSVSVPGIMQAMNNGGGQGAQRTGSGGGQKQGEWSCFPADH